MITAEWARRPDILCGDIIRPFPGAAVANGAGYYTHGGLTHMFTRSSSAEPRALEPRTAHANGLNGTPARLKPVATGEKSVIGNDLKIIGQGLKIIGRGVLQVDGEI